jgi:hypothetical protein
MAGLVPAIHVLIDFKEKEDVDARDKPGHDELERFPPDVGHYVYPACRK